MEGELGFDEKASSHIAAAHRLVRERDHVQCEPVHLLAVMLADEQGMVSTTLRRHGQDVKQLHRRVRDELPPAAPQFGDARVRSVRSGVLRVSSGFKAVVDGARRLAGPASGRAADELALLRAFGLSEHPDVRRLVETVGLLNVPREPSANLGPAGEEFEEASLFQLLGRYGRVLTAEAAAGLLDPVIGREHELRRVAYILGRRRKNNPVLIGEPGVGKTALVEGLAQAIANGTVPSAIAGKHVFALDVGSLVAGTRYRGEFEERVQLLLDTIAAAKGSVILFIDELHTIAHAGGAEGAIDAASFFKPLLARGELRAIGATTFPEFDQHIARDGALERRFQPVFVAEPSPAAALAMLRGLRPTYERHHGVSITDAALEAAIRISTARVPGRRLPDKAIDLVDEAASQKRALLDEQEGQGGGPRTSAGPGAAVEPVDVERVVEEWVGQDPRSRGLGRFAGSRPARLLRQLLPGRSLR